MHLFTLMCFPRVINVLIDVFVSMKRVEKFLLEEDNNLSQIIRYDLATIIRRISIKIENGNFSWGITERDKKYSETNLTIINRLLQILTLKLKKSYN